MQTRSKLQSGFAVALEVILDSRNGGFDGLRGVIDGWGGGGVFASGTPAEVRKNAKARALCEVGPAL